MTKSKKPRNITDRGLKTAQTLQALQLYKTQGEAAKSLGITRSTLIKRMDKWGLREIIEQSKQAAQEKLTMNAERAASKLVEKIDSEDENVSMKATTEVLDRSGVTKKQGEGTVNINFNKFVEQEKDHYGF